MQYDHSSAQLFPDGSQRGPILTHSVLKSEEVTLCSFPCVTVILIKNRAINPKTHYVQDFEILPVNYEAFFLFEISAVAEM